MDVRTAIRTRRSHKQFTGAAVPDQVLSELVELATWAPNHRLTEPWRFAVVRHERLPALLHAIEHGLRHEGGDEQKIALQVQKAKAVLHGAGGVITLLRHASPDDPLLDREDYAACACAMQNMQLAAWEQGFGSFWSTGGHFVGRALRGFWRAEPHDEVVGALILGVPSGELPAHRRKSLQDLMYFV